MSCNCDNTNVGCGQNPCAASAANTPECETLPSQISNFVSHFFGDIVKTEVNGLIGWELPCDLDVGLDNNPRAQGEGLACYFLRLFRDGITGLTGPQGEPGVDGLPGASGFSVTLQSFEQPAAGVPSIILRFAANPVIQPGQTIYIQDSGYYEVSSIGADWLVGLVPKDLKAGVSGTIPIGRIVSVAGPKGSTGLKGDTGDTGPAGPQGPAGTTYTAVNGFVRCAGELFELQLDFGQVVFGTVNPTVTLPSTGTYLVTAVVSVETAADATNEVVSFNLSRVGSGAVEGTTVFTRHLGASQRDQLVIQALVTSFNSSTIQLHGCVSVAGKASAMPQGTSMTFIKLSSS
jgi:hypothetical protein